MWGLGRGVGVAPPMLRVALRGFPPKGLACGPATPAKTLLSRTLFFETIKPLRNVRTAAAAAAVEHPLAGWAGQNRFGPAVPPPPHCRGSRHTRELTCTTVFAAAPRKGAVETSPAADEEVLLIDGEANSRIGTVPYHEAVTTAADGNKVLVQVGGGKGKMRVLKLIAAEVLAAQEAQKQAKAVEAEQELEKRKRDAYLQRKADAKRTKEIRLTALSGENDVVIKVNQARKFLGKGLRVLVTINLPGRQIAVGGLQTHKALMQRIVDDLYDHGVPTASPEVSKHRITCVIAPPADSK